MAGTFQTTIGGKLAILISLRDDDMIDILTIYNTAVTDTALEILGKVLRRKKPFSVAISVSPHICFVLVFILISRFLRSQYLN